jgi:hypothetical protein
MNPFGYTAAYEYLPENSYRVGDTSTGSRVSEYWHDRDTGNIIALMGIRKGHYTNWFMATTTVDKVERELYDFHFGNTMPANAEHIVTVN